MGLKAPGKYLDQFWSNKLLVLLLEKLKPNISMISGFLEPWEPLFVDLDILKYHNNISKLWKRFFKLLLS